MGEDEGREQGVEAREGVVVASEGGEGGGEVEAWRQTDAGRRLVAWHGAKCPVCRMEAEMVEEVEISWILGKEQEGLCGVLSQRGGAGPITTRHWRLHCLVRGLYAMRATIIRATRRVEFLDDDPRKRHTTHRQWLNDLDAASGVGRAVPGMGTAPQQNVQVNIGAQSARETQEALGEALSRVDMTVLSDQMLERMLSEAAAGGGG